MGRKLELGDLTTSEQARILEVIQRDFALRKNEDKRIEKLSTTITTQTRENDPNKCIVCESTFFWPFNRKVECTFCQLFFCKSKPNCGVKDLKSSRWICAFCNKEKEVQQMTLDWFYMQLKNKFRRHGGAKILRELYKNKRSVSPPPKPPRLTAVTSKTGSDGSTSISLIQNQKTDEHEHDTQRLGNLSETELNLRIQIEKAIASVLIPKIEELKSAQATSLDPGDSFQQVEELMDRFLNQAIQQKMSHQQQEEDLMWRYLKDHKQNVMLRIMKELTENSTGGVDFNSTVSSYRDAETMTEASDSEFESSITCSESMRSRRSSKAPLSERMRSLSPESLRGVLNSKQLPGKDQHIVQGVLRKDEMLATAEVNKAMSEILHENHDELDQAQEFSTELKFTAVGVNTVSFETDPARRSSDSDRSNGEDPTDDNWIIPPKQRKSLTFSKYQNLRPYLPPEDQPNAYYHVTTGAEESESEATTDVDEPVVLPVRIKKDFSEVSAQTLTGHIYEEDSEHEVPLLQRNISLHSDKVVDSMCKDLEDEDFQSNDELELPVSDPIQEDPVIPEKRKVTEQYRKALNVSAAITRMQNLKRTSHDSAYQSDVSKTFESDTSSLDGSIARFSKNWNNSKTSNAAQERKKFTSDHTNTEKENEECFIDQKFSEALDRGKETIIGKLSSSDGSDDDDSDNSHEKKTKKNTKDKRSPYLLRTIEFEVFEIEEKNKTKQDDVTASPFPTNGHEHLGDSASGPVEEERLSSTTHQQTLKQKQHHEDMSQHSSSSDISRKSSSSSSSLSLASDREHDTNNFEEKHASCVDGSASMQFAVYGSKRRNSLEDKLKNAIERRTIDEIVRDLQHAGLEVTKTKFNRASLTTASQQSTAHHKETNKTQLKKRFSAPQASSTEQDVNWNLYGFTVDPAHYKKSPPAKRQVSLTSLVLSDTESLHSSGTMSPRLSVTSPISGSGVPLLPSVAQRRSCFNSNEERHHPDGDRQNSTSSTNCDYDSDASSLVVDKLGYEADTSSVVTSERDVTPTLDLNYEAIKEESSADENSRTPVNELGSLSFNSDHVVKVIEHNILSEIANTVSETQSSPHCEDESRSYTSSDIESSSDSSNNEDLRNSVNSRGAPKNVVSPISHKLISPQRSTSSNQSLLSTSSSEFDRTAAVRGSLTMRGSYSSRVPEQSKKEPHKIHERKHSDRTPFVLQL